MCTCMTPLGSNARLHQSILSSVHLKPVSSVYLKPVSSVYLKPVSIALGRCIRSICMCKYCQQGYTLSQVEGMRAEVGSFKAAAEVQAAESATLRAEAEETGRLLQQVRANKSVRYDGRILLDFSQVRLNTCFHHPVGSIITRM